MTQHSVNVVQFSNFADKIIEYEVKLETRSIDLLEIVDKIDCIVYAVRQKRLRYR